MSFGQAGPVGIERDSEVPYYQQLSGVLEDRVRSGAIANNARLPSESALCREFGVSRATVRQAFQHLEAQGLVHRVMNRGVFAGGRDLRGGWTVREEDFLDGALTHRNPSVTTRVIRSGAIVLPDFAQQELGLPPGAEGFVLSRLRFLDGVPAAFSEEYLPPQVGALVLDALETLGGASSLSALLAASGYRTHRAHRSVRAFLPPDEVAESLGIDHGTPVVQVRSTHRTSDGLCFDVSECYVNTDVLPLEIAVEDRQGTSPR